MGQGMLLLNALISLSLIAWFIIFSVLVLKKLDTLIELSGRK
ncbi:MAG: hypothetical protein PHU96_06680 [Candidatus Omnitrophica bacterium]|nr:hypothetical protein [Candidatus Omnitrophota bacterium]